jgi:hypothetical protein
MGKSSVSLRVDELYAGGYGNHLNIMAYMLVPLSFIV